MEGITNERDGPCGSHRKKALHCQIFNVGYLSNCRQKAQNYQFHPDPACKLSANWYDIHHCCVYSEKLLMRYRGTVQNM
jgi:hypothetical protein